jgi:hypothetical protein
MAVNMDDSTQSRPLRGLVIGLRRVAQQAQAAPLSPAAIIVWLDKLFVLKVPREFLPQSLRRRQVNGSRPDSPPIYCHHDNL